MEKKIYFVIKIKTLSYIMPSIELIIALVITLIATNRSKQP
ncbi:hypothetical protein [Arsenophonus endosymbiont of Bemisia tabaci]|nr:hypothetical protein [Arsenophonus endosymbiont of Bemisia tabaci]